MTAQSITGFSTTETLSASSTAVASPNEPYSPSKPSSSRPSKSVIIRDAILGFADGLTVPFALTAGLSSLDNSRLVVIAGLAELFSGAISMGLGCYLAAVTEAKAYDVQERRLYEQGWKQWDVEKGTSCSHIQSDADGVYEALEVYGVDRTEACCVVQALSRKRANWVKFMLEVSLKEEKPATSGAWIEGAVMGLAYFIGGILPMIPYFCTKNTLHALIASIGETAIILLMFGYAKAHIIGCSVRDNLVSALHTLAVGIIAAGTSYGIVRGINSSSGSL